MTSCQVQISRTGSSLRFIAWVIAAAVGCGLWPSQVSAGAWLQPKGHGQLITTLTYHSSTGSFDDQGNIVSSQYRRIEIAPYLEYGLTDSITIGTEPRYQWAQSGTGNAKQTSQGAGDIDVFVRHSLWRIGPWITSAQATIILPDGYDRARRPAPGTGERGYEMRFLVGRNLRPKSSSYVNLESAYRFNEGGVADQFRLDATLGLKPWQHWLLLQDLSLTHSLSDGDGVPGHAYDLTKIQSSVVYFITDKVGVQAGYWRDVSGSGVSLGDSGTLALWFRF